MVLRVLRHQQRDVTLHASACETSMQHGVRWQFLTAMWWYECHRRVRLHPRYVLMRFFVVIRIMLQFTLPSSDRYPLATSAQVSGMLSLATLIIVWPSLWFLFLPKFKQV
jgi:hypothetical protein